MKIVNDYFDLLCLYDSLLCSSSQKDNKSPSSMILLCALRVCNLLYY